MQFAVDLAKRNYLYQSNRQNPQKQQNNQQAPIYDLSPSFTDKSTAMLAGTAISGIVSNLQYLTSRFFFNTLTRISGLPSLKETQQAVDKILKDDNFGAKGVKVIFADETPEENKKISEIITGNTAPRLRKFVTQGKKGFWDDVMRFFSDPRAARITRGDKASYFEKDKCAVTSKKAPQFIFHELGLAKICNTSWAKHFLSVGNVLPVLVVGVGLFALSHTPDKKKPEFQKGAWEKTKDFVDNHIQSITFLAFMPKFVGKAIASKEAWSMSKKHLPSENMKSLKLLYSIGLAAFMATAAASSLGVNIGNKVQNNIIRQKNSPQDVYNLLI